MSIYKNITLSFISTLMLVGCATNPQIATTNNDSNTVINKNEIMLKLKAISNYKQKLVSDVSTKELVKQDMLKQNADFANDNIKEALIENKKDDEVTTKPMFLEPKFAKIEIMPYETDSGIYHEQTSVWIKVEEGKIALKTNDDSSILNQNIRKSIIQR